MKRRCITCPLPLRRLRVTLCFYVCAIQLRRHARLIDFIGVFISAVNDFFNVDKLVACRLLLPGVR